MAAAMDHVKQHLRRLAVHGGALLGDQKSTNGGRR
jgi:hypothetical protein